MQDIVEGQERYTPASISEVLGHDRHDRPSLERDLIEDAGKSQGVWETPCVSKGAPMMYDQGNSIYHPKLLPPPTDIRVQFKV